MMKTNVAKHFASWKFLVMLMFVASISLGGCFGSAEADNPKHVNVMEFQKLINEVPGAVIVDVRTPQEFGAGHLQGAILLPVQVLDTKATQVLQDKNAPYFVYCRSGNRSEVAVNMLKKMGYTNVTNMLGGIIDWSNKGLPLTR